MMSCNGCLKNGIEGFCPRCKKELFGGKNVSSILNFSRPQFNELKLERSQKLSISGVQIKHSLKLENSELIMTEKGGEYILKPIPSGTFQYLNQTPANEHVTMQIASQVFKIETAKNTLIKFSDGELAYIVKRFDIKPDGTKYLQEDFAQIAQKTEENSGTNYKYDFSYEEIAGLMKKNVAAYPVEVEKYFRLVLFNYLICNGDAHLKNFSLYRNDEFGDYLLTPAYDLLNTSIHVPNESDTALELFKDGFMAESYKAGSKSTTDDFFEFGKRIGMRDSRVENTLKEFSEKYDRIKLLIEKSFLNDEMKSLYLTNVQNRMERIQ